MIRILLQTIIEILVAQRRRRMSSGNKVNFKHITKKNVALNQEQGQKEKCGNVERKNDMKMI